MKYGFSVIMQVFNQAYFIKGAILSLKISEKDMKNISI